MVQSCCHSTGQAHPGAGKAAMPRPACSPWLETSVRPAQPQPLFILIPLPPATQSSPLSLSAVVTGTLCCILFLYLTWTDEKIFFIDI